MTFKSRWLAKGIEWYCLIMHVLLQILGNKVLANRIIYIFCIEVSKQKSEFFQDILEWDKEWDTKNCCPVGKLVESGYKPNPYLWQVLLYKGFPDSSVGQESAFNAGDPSSIPGSERYLLDKDRLPTPVFLGFPCGWLVKNLPITQETWVWSLGWEDPLWMERLPTPVFWPG